MLMNKTNLRNVSANELDAVMDLYQSYIGTPGCTWDENYPNREILLDDYSSGGLYGLYIDDKLIGAISVCEENYLDELLCWNQACGAKEIARVVISPQHREKHYGTLLLQMLFSHLQKQGTKAIHLLVSPDNHRAFQLYCKFQFETRGKFFLYTHDYLALEKIF